jgi:hypothetical protein
MILGGMNQGSHPDPAVEAALKVAGARIAEGWLDQARVVLKPLAETHPDDGQVLRLQGLVAFKLGHEAEGLAQLRRATERSPDNFTNWSDLGVACRVAGLGDEAATAFARSASASDADRMWGAQVPPARRTFSTDDGYHRFKVVDYDYQAEVRYGGHRGAHPDLAAMIEASRPRYEGLIDEMGRHGPRFAQLPLEGDYESRLPFWRNTWFAPLDGMALYTLLAQLNPARFVEVGSGTSTKFARMAVNDHGLKTRLTSIDPAPRAQIDSLCDQVVRRQLEHCDPAPFDTLEAGDVLFLDSSHRAFQNSDVTVAFLDILPRLKPGVLVHIHDIWLPYDYPRGHLPRQWNEQYMLATALLFAPRAFEMLFPCQFVVRDAALAKHARLTLGVGPLADLHLHGTSFWMRKA